MWYTKVCWPNGTLNCHIIMVLCIGLTLFCSVISPGRLGPVQFSSVITIHNTDALGKFYCTLSLLIFYIFFRWSLLKKQRKLLKLFTELFTRSAQPPTFCVSFFYLLKLFVFLVFGIVTSKLCHGLWYVGNRYTGWATQSMPVNLCNIWFLVYQF